MIQVDRFYIEHSVSGVVVRKGESHATAQIALRVPHEHVELFCEAMQKIAQYKDLANRIAAVNHQLPKYIRAMCKDEQLEMGFDAIQNLDAAADKWGLERTQLEEFAKLIQP